MTMLTGRRHRLISVLFALCSFVFMQMAVAGYVCPGAASQAAEAAVMVEAGMPCAESKSLNMDDAQPNLCQAHCQTGQQTASKYVLPPLPAAAAIGPGFMHVVTEPVFLGTSLQTPDLRRTTAPAVAIRNCCFRI